MTINKRRKNSRQRGSQTHGWGAMKKHRGAGNRGGRGMAGTGKRADTLKPSIIKYFPDYFGKHGFRIPQKIKKTIKAINISELPDAAEINLTKLGYDKLLGDGKVAKKYKIIVSSVSKKAKEKIEKAGGQILQEEQKEKKAEKKEKQKEKKEIK